MSDDPTLAAIEQREKAASAVGAGDGAVFESWLDVPYLLDRLRATEAAHTADYAEQDDRIGELQRQVAAVRALMRTVTRYVQDNGYPVSAVPLASLLDVLGALDSAQPQDTPDGVDERVSAAANTACAYGLDDDDAENLAVDVLAAADAVDPLRRPATPQDTPETDQ